MMRQSSIPITFLIALVCLTQPSCKKINQLLTFTITDKSAFTIPASSAVGLPANFPTPDVTSNSSAAFESNNTDKNHVKNVYLEDLNLTITSPSGQTFDFVRSVHIYISAQGVSEIELAGTDAVPAGVRTISLTPTEAKLDAYIKADSYTLRTEVVTKELINQDVDVQADSRFKVTAKL